MTITDTTEKLDDNKWKITFAAQFPDGRQGIAFTYPQKPDRALIGRMRCIASEELQAYADHACNNQ